MKHHYARDINPREMQCDLEHWGRERRLADRHVNWDILARQTRVVTDGEAIRQQLDDVDVDMLARTQDQARMWEAHRAHQDYMDTILDRQLDECEARLSRDFTLG